MRIFCRFLLCLLSMCLLVRAEEKHPQDTEEACRNFVQRFYDSYASNAADTTLKSDPLALALRDKRQAFSAELISGLEELSKSQAKDQEVWLDFDPILNTQDPAKRYVVARVTRKGGSYWVEVEVNETKAGNKDQKPIVVPEVAFRRRGWVFVNFHYPGYSPSSDNENLLSILKTIHLAPQNDSK